MSKDIPLTYPGFSKTFDVHTKASKFQVSTVSIQDNKPIAVYSRNINLAQTKYTNSKRELLE